MDAADTEHLLAWLGPDPARIDAAAVRFVGDRLTAWGTSTTTDWTVSYHLRAGPQWVTERLDVRVADRGGVFPATAGDEPRLDAAHDGTEAHAAIVFG